jgi:hypothetical protein
MAKKFREVVETSHSLQGRVRKERKYQTTA